MFRRSQCLLATSPWHQPLTQPPLTQCTSIPRSQSQRNSLIHAVFSCIAQQQLSPHPLTQTASICPARARVTKPPPPHRLLHAMPRATARIVQHLCFKFGFCGSSTPNHATCGCPFALAKPLGASCTPPPRCYCFPLLFLLQLRNLETDAAVFI
jgi:hypothetical protein